MSSVSGAYKLDCYGCGRTLTVPPRDGEQECPSCGAVLWVEWNAARQPDTGRAA